ncbi:hypothetical protein ASE66_23785 [Bosea sp. Root483D1]|nr:hypothetical protein ASE66_23785 [Bosea sp. Root483D1]
MTRENESISTLSVGTPTNAPQLVRFLIDRTDFARILECLSGVQIVRRQCGFRSVLEREDR